VPLRQGELALVPGDDLVLPRVHVRGRLVPFGLARLDHVLLDGAGPVRRALVGVAQIPALAQALVLGVEREAPLAVEQPV